MNTYEIILWKQMLIIIVQKLILGGDNLPSQTLSYQYSTLTYVGSNQDSNLLHFLAW